MEELSLGWLQDKVGDYLLKQPPAHDVTALEALPLGPKALQLPSCQDLVKKVSLNTPEHPQPILLALGSRSNQYCWTQ